MTNAIQKPESVSRVAPRVLLVDDEPALLEFLSDAVSQLDCTVITATSLAQARRKLSGKSIDLLVTDVGLPDGNGMSLLAQLRKEHPAASAIVITGSPTVDGAISALRGGAIDFVPKPFSHDQLLDRVQSALARRTQSGRQHARIVRLKKAVRKLGEARRTVSQKVDLLCNDLVNAYSDLARQMDTVRLQESFRKHIEPAADLEQLLCHTMDWMLRQLGHANVALWLAADDGDFQLGAYMKHTVEGSDLVADTLRLGVLPPTLRDEFLHASGADIQHGLNRDQRKVLAGQDVLAVTATYLGEPLAACIFFRPGPFTEAHEDVLKSISPVFANALATVVRDPSVDSDPGSLLLDDGDDEDDRKKSDDWWRKGEPPPF
jgi:DNA-binding response OmpR family regulator